MFIGYRKCDVQNSRFSWIVAGNCPIPSWQPSHHAMQRDIAARAGASKPGERRHVRMVSRQQAFKLRPRIMLAIATDDSGF